jgi:peptidoglycan/LPS O-acetylase OafA/YrhL
MNNSRSEHFLRYFILIVVGAIGAAVGFDHTHKWAIENNQTGWTAWAVAIVIESMVVIAGLELRRKFSRLPLAVLIGAFLLQMAAQVSSARDTFAGWVLAATPALGFLLIVKMVLRPTVKNPVFAGRPTEPTSKVQQVSVNPEPVQLPHYVQPVVPSSVSAWPPVAA